MTKKPKNLSQLINTLNSRNFSITPLSTLVQAEHFSVHSSDSKDPKFAGIRKFPEWKERDLM